MAETGEKRRLLITVRTYPAPAQKGAETSCTAAVSEDGKWVRLFPVPYRSLPPDKRFSKYQWITAQIKKARSDARPESHNISIDTIELGEVVSTKHEWAARKAILAPLMRPSLCAIQRERDEKGYPTLGLFRSAKIERLTIKPCEATDWTAEQRAILSQKGLFDTEVSKEELEKIPLEFRYEFKCDDPLCKGHKMLCTDWEMAESYRNWRTQYGDDGWEAKFRERYERDMIERFDTHFYVGTMHGHPGTWIIVGLFYPPKEKIPTQGRLF